MSTQPEPNPQQGAPSREHPWTIATMNQKVAEWIGRLGAVWIEAEITAWNPHRNGMIYGRMRDVGGDSSVEIIAYRELARQVMGKFVTGQKVLAYVRPTFWAPGGKYSVQILEITHTGIGELMERLEQLRLQLQMEGLFAEDRKKPLPFLPQLIGLITGRDSDAEKDVKQNALRRWEGVRFREYYAAVQGANAAAEVIAGIKALDADPEVDLIIIARGGGDFLHLLPFSDEQLVRTAAAAHTPIISAIGHENDRPLLDYVADLRASTPTDAAKRAVPDIAEELTRVLQARTTMSTRLLQRITAEMRSLESIRSRPVLAQPGRIIDGHTQDLARWQERMDGLINQRVRELTADSRELTAKLRALSPLATLQRGYAIAQRVDEAGGGATLLRHTSDAPAGSTLKITLADGSITATASGSTTPTTAKGDTA